MLNLIKNMFSWLPSFKASGSRSSVALELMDSAEACAGRNPQEAQELRNAAMAYLRVVR